MTTSSSWTDERRARQAAAIHRWKPWTRSTGPRTAAGKAIASQNGRRPNLIRRELVELKKQLKEVAKAVNAWRRR